MAIEWGLLNQQTSMTFRILDNNGLTPTEVLTAGQPFRVEVSWDVPAIASTFINASDSFRVRAYAESVGPGQEVPLGQIIVTGVPFQQSYIGQVINVNPNPLLGEEQPFGGVPVSGVYNIVCVLQHLSAGIPTVHSGMSDYQRTIMFRAP